MLTFRDASLYTTDKFIHFWIKVPLPCDLEKIKSPLKNIFLNFEFLDTHRFSESPWKVAFLYNGKLYNSIHEKPIKKEIVDPWWISTTSLRTPNEDEEARALWMQNDVSTDGLVVLFLGEREALKNLFTIGLGTLQVK